MGRRRRAQESMVYFSIYRCIIAKWPCLRYVELSCLLESRAAWVVYVIIYISQAHRATAPDFVFDLGFRNTVGTAPIPQGGPDAITLCTRLLTRTPTVERQYKCRTLHTSTHSCLLPEPPPPPALGLSTSSLHLPRWLAWR